MIKSGNSLLSFLLKDSFGVYCPLILIALLIGKELIVVIIQAIDNAEKVAVLQSSDQFPEVNIKLWAISDKKIIRLKNINRVIGISIVPLFIVFLFIVIARVIEVLRY